MKKISSPTNISKRDLTTPLRIGIHYGHPVVFDKLFFITRGGTSKTSKGINISEDIFTGFFKLVKAVMLV